MARSLVRIGGGLVDGAVSGGELVVVDDQCAVFATPVGVGKDILIDGAVGLVKIVEKEILALGEQPALVKQWSNFTIVARHQSLIGIFLVTSAAELHSVLLSEAFDLTVAEHRQARQSRHHGGDTKKLVAITELVNGCALIRIAHEVDVALEDIRVEFDS